MLFGDARSGSCLNESRRASSIDNVIRPSFKKMKLAQQESSDKEPLLGMDSPE